MSITGIILELLASTCCCLGGESAAPVGDGRAHRRWAGGLPSPLPAPASSSRACRTLPCPLLPLPLLLTLPTRPLLALLLPLLLLPGPPRRA